MLDAWGIADGYFDIDGTWHETTDATRAVLRAAMGDPQPAGPQWFVPVGEAHQLHGACRLLLEDGEDRGVIDALPDDVPCGYHHLVPVDGGPTTWLVVPPRACPDAPFGWGVAAQVYSLWRRDGWGIGDLEDVAELGAAVAARGGVAALLSPLHAPAPTSPQEDSPYYPSSRRWLNPLLIPVVGPPPAAVDNQPGGTIGRDLVWQAKRRALAARFASERDHPEWRRWAIGQGHELTAFCAYNVLAEDYGPDWRTWPDDVRRPDAPGVAARTADPSFAERLELHAWIQWVAADELQRAADVAAGCALIGDLAVGCSPYSADTWIHQDLIAHGVTIGAPPDPFNAEGQSWGLPPLVPWRLRQAGFAPFIGLLRAAFTSMGGVRIDHVMGLFRQFWIPEGGGPADGAYVYLPHDELLALVCLEAHRAGAFVIGEDLGTVEPEVRSALAAVGMLGTKVLLFDEDAETWPAANLGTVTTHDLPTVAGILAARTGDDDGDDEVRGVLHRLVGVSVDVPADVPADAAVDVAVDVPVVDVLVAAHAAIARSPARLVLATVDDLAGSRVRPNRPGTISSADSGLPANWSHRLAASSADLLARSPGADIIAAFAAARPSPP
ncbi:MAG: 4-alpha-glucanotransferase [Ilumatobacteraceae bacterium]|nr:4-alpha-glucanotransferase [Ilumatobacteraceae bacterium]